MFFCYSGDTHIPELVEHPVNRSALINSTVTFNRAANGLPRPTTQWMRENNLYPLKYSEHALFKTTKTTA